MGGAETRLEVASLAEKFDGTRGLTLDGQNSAQPVVRRGRFGMLLCNRLVDFSALVQLARSTERFAQGQLCGKIVGVLAQRFLQGDSRLIVLPQRRLRPPQVISPALVLRIKGPGAFETHFGKLEVLVSIEKHSKAT